MPTKKKVESDNKKREDELHQAFLKNDELRARLSKVQTKYSALLAGHILEDDILGYFTNKIDSMDPIVTDHLKLHDITKAKKDNRYDEEAILPLSDFHLGEIVIPEEINDLNCYNLEILEHRLGKLVEDVQKITMRALSGYRLQTLHVPLLGDIVSGAIHEELVETNEFVAVDMCLHAQRVIVETLLKLHEIFPKINVYSVSGNHGRLTEKMRFKRGWNNWDYLVGKQVEIQIKHSDCADNFTFDVPKTTIMSKKIGEHNFMFEHGHGIRMYNGIPYYGINRYATDNQVSLLDSHRSTIDHFIIGHFHQSAKIPISGASFFMNGSLIGTNEYARNKLHKSANPSVWFFGIVPRQKGRISFMYELNELDEGEKHLWK